MKHYFYFNWIFYKRNLDLDYPFHAYIKIIAEWIHFLKKNNKIMKILRLSKIKYFKKTMTHKILKFISEWTSIYWQRFNEREKKTNYDINDITGNAKGGNEDETKSVLKYFNLFQNGISLIELSKAILNIFIFNLS